MKDSLIESYASELQLLFVRENWAALTHEATQHHWTFARFLGALLEGEIHRRQDNRVRRRIKAARFPVLKRLEDFDWNWPKKINRPQVQELFGLAFLQEHANVILLGGVGLGKTHLAIALGYAACLQGHSVRFTTAVDIINTLAAAQANHLLKHELKKYLAPTLLIMDEVGYLPIDKTGADLLFQVLSQRYESGSIVLTTNQPYKRWSSIFNNDATLTSAILDRLLHHAYTLTLEGRSYRMKDQIQD